MFSRHDHKIDHLRSVALFADLDRSTLQRIATLLDEIDLPAGRALTRQGEPAREFLFIVEGRARVEIDGRHVATLGPGEVVGEIGVLGRTARTATVIAETPVRVFVGSAHLMRSLLDTDPSVPESLSRTVAQRTPAA